MFATEIAGDRASFMNLPLVIISAICVCCFCAQLLALFSSLRKDSGYIQVNIILGVETGSVTGQLSADLQNLGLSAGARQRITEHINHNAEQTKLAVLIARWWNHLDTLTLQEFVSWPKQLNWAEVRARADVCFT
jgi:hypothetical protein